MPGAQRLLFSTLLIAFSLGVALSVGEVALRVKKSSMTTYDIEIWRYAKDLNARSDDPQLDFDHVRSKSAVLQNVLIRLNERGRILFLGGSITDIAVHYFLLTFHFVVGWVFFRAPTVSKALGVLRAVFRGGGWDGAWTVLMANAFVTLLALIFFLAHPFDDHRRIKLPCAG